MKVTSAYANKLIRGYREELAAIVSNERDTCTTTYGASETPIETGYNFTSTHPLMLRIISNSFPNVNIFIQILASIGLCEIISLFMVIDAVVALYAIEKLNSLFGHLRTRKKI